MPKKITFDINIRRGVISDLETITGFNAAMAQETESKTLDLDCLRSGVSAVLSDEGLGFYLVAEIEDQIVGQLMVTTEWSDWRNAHFWWIQSVYVDPGFRRQGVYRSLDRQVKDEALNLPGVCGLRLYVDRDNRVAQAVYARLEMQHSNYDMYEIDFNEIHCQREMDKS